MEQQNTIDTLRQRQSLPLEAKVNLTKMRIRDWYDHWDGEVYLSFSGGKDSTVLKHIVDSMYDDVPSVFVNTGLEYPEVRQFAMGQKNVIRLDPRMKFYDVIERYGYPVVSKEQAKFLHELRVTKSEKHRNRCLYGNRWGRGKISEKWKFLIDAPFKVSHKCCDVMKKDPLKRYEKETGRRPMVGTLACESQLRTTMWLLYGCNAFEKTRPMSQPLSFWTEQDVLQYVVDNNLSVASVYGQVVKDEDGQYKTTGCDRTGCMFCMFGAHLDDTPNRFQRMAHTHPKQYEYCMGKLGLRKVLDYIGINYE